MTEDFNHLNLAGFPISDVEYCEQFNLDPSLANTPAINDDVIKSADDPFNEESRIEFLYALNGLRELAKDFNHVNNSNSTDTGINSDDSNNQGQDL